MTDNQKKVVAIAMSLIFIFLIFIVVFFTMKIYSQESKINSKADTAMVKEIGRTLYAKSDTILKNQLRFDTTMTKFINKIVKK
jgi:hypothetical protein